MKVSRYQEKILNQIKPETKLNGDKKEISITFDDGYGRENIVNILNVLKEKLNCEDFRGFNFFNGLVFILF